MQNHAVLFDLDGTLLNTLEDVAGAMNAALLELGAPPHPVEKYRYFVG
jgi:phosphoglycolate phosphatase